MLLSFLRIQPTPIKIASFNQSSCSPGPEYSAANAIAQAVELVAPQPAAHTCGVCGYKRASVDWSTCNEEWKSPGGGCRMHIKKNKKEVYEVSR